MRFCCARDAYFAEYQADLDRQEGASRPTPALLRFRRLMAERVAGRQAPGEP